MNYTQHRQKWNDCQLCSLCLTRKYVVLARGHVPCEILLIGEGPGVSEDTLGQAFIGPAGSLLDKIITSASKGKTVRFAFTNLVACLPIGGEGKKAGEPDKQSIEACRPRLAEMIEIANPRAIITVGKLSDQYAWLATSEKETYEAWGSIVHPASILRAEKSQQGLMMQNCIVTIRDVIEELGI